MKKILGIFFLILLFSLSYFAWVIFGPRITLSETRFFYIKTGSNYEEVKTALKDSGILSGMMVFDQLAKRYKYPKNIRPGRYEIKNGMSIYNLVKLLRSGKQSPIRFVINKIRTREDLAGKIGQQFEVDSAEVIRFINNNDSLLKYGLDTNNMMTIIIPNSYLFWWNLSVKNIITRFADQKKNFWAGKRTLKAKALKLNPDEVYTLASIVEEETTKEKDKGLVASVYLNRMNKGMKLEADPTVKYGMRNFGLKRILFAHLKYPSPYNTYINPGLPPGPIATPSISTIDAVLDAPKTDYIFFVAKPDFSGYSNFASSYPQHMMNARAYQHALDSLIIGRNK